MEIVSVGAFGFLFDGNDCRPVCLVVILTIVTEI
jgi:hypothetical protein